MIAISLQEIAFPLKEMEKTFKEISFSLKEIEKSLQEMAFTLQEIAISLQMIAISLQEIAFPLKEMEKTFKEIAFSLKEIGKSLQEMVSLLLSASYIFLVFFFAGMFSSAGVKARPFDTKKRHFSCLYFTGLHLFIKNNYPYQLFLQNSFCFCFQLLATFQKPSS